MMHGCAAKYLRSSQSAVPGLSSSPRVFRRSQNNCFSNRNASFQIEEVPISCSSLKYKLSEESKKSWFHSFPSDILYYSIESASQICRLVSYEATLMKETTFYHIRLFEVVASCKIYQKYAYMRGMCSKQFFIHVVIGNKLSCLGFLRLNLD